MVDSTCKHEGNLSAVRTEYYAYLLRPLLTPGSYVVDWTSGDFEEGGEFQQEVVCCTCGYEISTKLSELDYGED